MVVQAIEGSNDIGKDLYVDIAEAGVVTGELIAIQVKSGNSYRRKSGYAIPCSQDDLTLWAASSVPIFGVVFDPDSGSLHWTNLTAWARSQSREAPPRAAPVSATWRLNSRTLGQFVLEARAFLAASGPPALLGLADPDPRVQRDAVYDAFALGRRDARALLLLRAALRYLDAPEALRPAIHFLALCVGHGDIAWSAANWLDDRIRSHVRNHFDWSDEEYRKLLAAPDPEEWSRGGLGQDVAALVCSGWGPDVEKALQRVAVGSNEDAASAALMLLISGIEGSDAIAVLDSLEPKLRALKGSTWVSELRACITEHGSVSLW